MIAAPYKCGMDKLQRLVARSEINDAMLRYCRGVDRRDWELMRSAFFDDAHDDHADFHGRRDEFVAWLSDRHDTPGMLKSSHLLSNCFIEFASPVLAVVETYFTARLEMSPDAGGHRDMLAAGSTAGHASVEVLGRYIDRFEQRAGEWRVARRRTVFDSMRSDTVSSVDVRNSSWLLGTRDASDPLHAARREAGLPNSHNSKGHE